VEVQDPTSANLPELHVDWLTNENERSSDCWTCKSIKLADFLLTNYPKEKISGAHLCYLGSFSLRVSGSQRKCWQKLEEVSRSFFKKLNKVSRSF
jgi:hypothetical protein